jgi:hypothetical protein
MKKKKRHGCLERLQSINIRNFNDLLIFFYHFMLSLRDNTALLGKENELSFPSLRCVII